MIFLDYKKFKTIYLTLWKALTENIILGTTKLKSLKNKTKYYKLELTIYVYNQIP